MPESFEYAIKKDVRNNPIVREVDEERQRDLWKSVGIAGFLVLALLFSAWQHFELLRHGYQVEEMQRQRETEEEAGANIELGALFTLLNVKHVHQVHLFYLARLRDLDFAAGIESLEVQLFSEHEIPWDELAFPTIRTTLELFFADRVKMREGGSYGFHTHDIARPMRAATTSTGCWSTPPAGWASTKR